MASKAAYKRLTKEYQTLQKNPTQYITAHPSESNILEWHYILTGPPETPYAGGQYWGTLNFPPDYPFAPPAIRMHTPSGRFRPSERLCLSISDFHPKSFNPAWEVSTILLGVLSFMTSEEMTTGSVSATEQERRVLAGKTRWWNSTGGGSTTRTLGSGPTGDGGGSAGTRGFGAIKAGDGGKRFREHWPEVDEENWAWMEREKVDPRTGRGVVPVREVVGEVGGECGKDQGRTAVGARAQEEVVPREQSWLGRNKWYIAVAALFAYVLAARAMGDQQQ